MKMSEEFDLPLRSEGDIYSSESELPIGSFNYDSFDNAAVHAINCHDELVEALTGLVKAYENLDGAFTSKGSWHSHAKAALDKAGE